jgi:hypothetical protein
MPILLIEKRVSHLLDAWRIIAAIVIGIASYFYLGEVGLGTAAMALVLLLAVYHLGVWLIGLYLLQTISDEEAEEILHNIQMDMVDEIRAGINDGSLKPGPQLNQLMKEAGLGAPSVITGFGPVFGKLDDTDLYDFIIAKEGDNEPRTFMYLGKVQQHADGSYIMPSNESDDTNFYVIFKGILYEHVPS